MIHKIFCIYDSKAEAFNAPFYMNSRGSAIRSFVDAATGKDDSLTKHPGDFTLFELGEYDYSNGSFNLHATPVSLGVAVELIPSSV